jgi:UDP-sulfoquinovose synthase
VDTQLGNIDSTLNIVWAAREAPHHGCHIVKLGTMGQYGTPGIPIGDGRLSVVHNGEAVDLSFPKSPGSWYHASKAHDSCNLELAAKVYGLAVTDLNQGIVYGARTAESVQSEALRTRLDYDHVFGTVINRFCVQAALGGPLTPYGSGGQARSFIALHDSLQALEVVLGNPASPGEFRVSNQFSEVLRIWELAERVVAAAEDRGLAVQIDAIVNPRVEAENHPYEPECVGLRALGFEPERLTQDRIGELVGDALVWKERVRPGVLEPKVSWSSTIPSRGLQR